MAAWSLSLPRANTSVPSSRWFAKPWQAANSRLEDLAAIAATSGPGLAGCLLVGLTYAKSLSYARGIPLIGVNHIEGHIHAVIMEAKSDGAPVELPALALVVSGGHTHLFEVADGFRYRLLGKTRDDAAGEAFDKVGKLLGYAYPGGPIVDRLAAYGDPRAVRFTFAKMKCNAFDFSFSGLKTAVLRWVEAHDMAAEIDARRALWRENPTPSTEEWLERTPQATLDLLASFQNASDYGTADASRCRSGIDRGAGDDRLRRSRLQLRSACGGEGWATAVSRLFPDAWPFHRQRGNDRRRRVS